MGVRSTYNKDNIYILMNCEARPVIIMIWQLYLQWTRSQYRMDLFWAYFSFEINTFFLPMVIQSLKFFFFFLENEHHFEVENELPQNISIRLSIMTVCHNAFNAY